MEKFHVGHDSASSQLPSVETLCAQKLENQWRSMDDFKSQPRRRGDLDKLKMLGGQGVFRVE